VLLGLLTVLGAFPASATLLGLAPLFGHDVWLHGAEALAAGYVGFVVPAGAVVSRREPRGPLAPPRASPVPAGAGPGRG
jgi:hypothetical protein